MRPRVTPVTILKAGDLLAIQTSGTVVIVGREDDFPEEDAMKLLKQLDIVCEALGMPDEDRWEYLEGSGYIAWSVAR